MPVIYAQASDFQEKTETGTVLLDFYADWCAPCRMLGPVLEQIANENEDIKVVKVNVDENQALAGDFGVRGIPALFVLKEGKQVAQRAGFMPKDALVDWVKNA
jgi:thioredoxin 1